MSMAVDLKLIHKIDQKHKDIVNGYIKTIKHDSIIPDTIIQLITLFFLMIDTEILTNEEITTILQLLSNHKSASFDGKSWKLIYRFTRDGRSRTCFVDHVHCKPNIICLIKTTGNEVFGGYTAIGWMEKFRKGGYHVPDRDAFLFRLRHRQYEPKIFTPKNMGVRYEWGSWCVFSKHRYWGHWIEIADELYSDKYYAKTGKIESGESILSSKNEEELEQLEVFQLI